ncbi:Thg1-domain-containing protein [Lophiostoma macrostomum CBS 122681]|uniref:tRNA(His) guanylyltransferase n=1 Tax=Lophiostoma macrostomum CBS 122681 TaxID=1314788 RepID=A0A6A6TTN1_9PLEO|nr:Thg1-domain-containing protein [Lophiostoma macrostomum CBS 122681]
MANSKYEYVRSFEQHDILLSNTWIVVRIDGRGFSKLTAKYKFTKPNDERALNLMNAAAEAVMKELPDLVLAYGNSDEFSFVFHKDCVLFERRASKLTTTIVSTFTSYYTFLWPTYFPATQLTPPLPSFDGRAVCYPSDQNLRDYISWRQVDCHINNLYNTAFWTLVQQGGMEARAAERELSGTVSSDKNEILFSRFQINYNNEPEIFRKGSVLYRDFFPMEAQSSPPPQSTREPPVLSHPQPRRALTRPMSQPLERTIPGLLEDSPASTVTTPRGPTFLSTSTTPSPPPSPSSMSIPAFPFPQNFVPVSPPPSGTATASTSMAKHSLPRITPLPLPPPTLKPSTKPPPSLSPPNPAAHTNFSPLASPSINVPDRTTSSHPRIISHSASASLTMPSSSRTMVVSTSTPKPTLKHRSPSLSVLEGQPPVIPLRISSIPANTKPRKLSLPSQKSFSNLQSNDKENATTSKPSRPSPPMSTMKELPSPPIDSTFPHLPQSPEWTETQWADIRTPDAMDQVIPNPIFGSPDALRSSRCEAHTVSRRSRSHSRLHSAPTSFFPSPPSKSDLRGKAPVQSSMVARSQANTGKAKVTEEGGWAAGTKDSRREGKERGKEKEKERESGVPKEMSRTQRDKDRKRRTKARIVVEHVDVIKDEFWERRPWIQSGKAGV